MKVDLHTHSFYSDGENSPEELVAMAKKAGLEAYALTDHDTVKGVDEAISWGKKMGVNVISGIELSSIKNGDVHIIGLGIDTHSKELNEKVVEIQKKREVRNRAILNKLSEYNIVIDYDDLLKAGVGKVIGRSLISQLMIRKGYVKSISEAFDNYLGNGKSCYVPLIRLTPEDAIDIILKAKGYPVLAHPSKLMMSESDRYEFIKHLSEIGLLGIESYYYAHSLKEVAYFESIANAFGLFSTAGSDFHGKIRNTEIGVVPKEVDERVIMLLGGK